MLIIDLDETVLSTRPTLLNSNVNLTPSVFNPYGGSDVCYTLNKNKLAQLFRRIINANGDIAVATASSLSAQQIKYFFYVEFNIDLKLRNIFRGLSFSHGNQKYNLDKTQTLYQIAHQHTQLEVCFVDNALLHIQSASRAGFKTLYADTNYISGESNRFINTLTMLSWRMAGDFHRQHRDFLPAAHAFNEVAKISGHSKDWRIAGIHYIKAKDFRSAIYTLKKAAKVSRNARDQRQIAKCYIEIGDFKSAAHAFSQAAQISGDPKDQRQVAKFYIELGDFEAAAHAFSQAAQISGDPKDQRQVAKFYIELGDFKSAAHAFTQAAQISGDPRDQRQIAKCYIELGDFESAAHAFTQAAQISDDPRDQRQVAKCYIEIGDFESAADAFNQAAQISHDSRDQHEAKQCYMHFKSTICISKQAANISHSKKRQHANERPYTPFFAHSKKQYWRKVSQPTGQRYPQRAPDFTQR
ncbi:tetratricopeptide repeat protein [Piscirickettsia salmonis]|uniref:tetratricopeptide repeat protein n=1 Tax=Piscirickettsia salmonis TaxID=1238 RepID=UPI001E5C2715|nr:tetratricopeptide repeat protein [Piscirickettsia salmonis]